jgi:hypothetical protein
MLELGRKTLSGRSGIGYHFDMYSRSTEFRPLPAIYVMVRYDAQGHNIVYIGETEDLSSLSNNHHRKTCFDQHGANHVWVHTVSNPEHRHKAKADLRDAIRAASDLQ